MSTINITCKAHLTENHQLQAADKLIAKLKQELAAANEYIAELEETSKKDVNYELKQAYEGLQLKYDNLDKERRQLARMVNEEFKEIYKEEKFSKLKDENSELKKLNKRLAEERDKLIYRLNNQEHE